MKYVPIEKRPATVYDTTVPRGNSKLLNTLLGYYQLSYQRVREVTFEDNWMLYDGEYVGYYRWIGDFPVFGFYGEFEIRYEQWSYTIEPTGRVTVDLVPFVMNDDAEMIGTDVAIPWLATELARWLEEQLADGSSRTKRLFRESGLTLQYVMKGPSGRIPHLTIYFEKNVRVLEAFDYINRNFVCHNATQGRRAFGKKYSPN